MTMLGRFGCVLQGDFGSTEEPTFSDDMLGGLTVACCCVIVVVLLSSRSGALSAFKSKIGRLSIDYGPRIIGLAHGNHIGVVKPHGTIQNTGTLSNVASKVIDLARTWSVSEIILGVPLDSNGKLHYNVRNFNGQLCLNFSKVLTAMVQHDYPNKFQVILFDERYTTKEASLRLHNERIKASLDAMSAACLLERYIEDSGEGSLPANECSYPIPPELDNFDYDTVRRHVRSMYTARMTVNTNRNLNRSTNKSSNEHKIF